MPRSAPSAPVARAVVELRAGRPDLALDPLRRAAALDPRSAAVHHDLGLACLETARLGEAVEALRRAVAIDPGYTDAHFRLGLALERAGDPGGAVTAYDRATELQPSHAEAWYRAGSLVFTLGHREAAIGCFRRAATAGRKGGIGRLGAARALLADGRDDEAERVLRQLRAREPDNAVAHDLLGNLHADAGRFVEARACFVEAVRAGPLMAGSYYDLVRCRRVTEADADLVPSMRSALENADLPPEQRVRVHLALGKAQDDLGDPAAAMGEFDRADAVRRTISAFDADAFERQVERLIAFFSPERIAGGCPVARPELTPVLIMGMPRSGTTLTEQILSSHASVGAGGELNFWNERGTAWLAANLAPIDGPGFAAVASDYLSLLDGIAPGAARVTDKMPFNFLWAGLVHLLFPNAVLLHCRRAAIDVALSVHQTLFNPGLAFPTGGEELVRYIRAARRLTGHWRRVLPPDRFVEIDYAALASRPEPTIRAMIASCGLSWDEACTRPELNARAVRTPSRWQARQPIYRDAVERWRRYEPVLGPLARLLEPDPGAPPAT